MGLDCVVRIAVLSASWFFVGIVGAIGQEPPDSNEAEPSVKDVIIVCKQHFDIGYTAFAHEVLDFYRGPMFDRALATIQETKDAPKELQFVWTVPGWPMKEILGPKQEAGRGARIEEALRSGRVVLHAMAGTTHTESLDLESYARGFRFSSDICRRLDLPLPRDAKMTDVPSHAWITPTLLHHAGVDFFHFAGNSACRQPEAPMLFWWEGPDGSRVLTVHTVGYGTGLTPPENWPYSAWLYVMHTGDNHGPPDAAGVEAMLAEVKNKLPCANVRMGRLSDFYDALMREENPEIPVVRGDMPDAWIHGIMSLPKMTKLIGEARAEAFALTTLNTHLSLWGLKAPDSESALDELHEKSFLYSEHTWGGSTSRFGLGEVTYADEFRAARAEGRYKKIEAMWDEHRQYARDAANAVHPPLKDTLAQLAEAVAVDGPRVVVFNPLPFERDGLVEIPGVPPGTLIDAAQGKPIASDRDENGIRFIAKDVPPSGYKTYLVGKAEVTPTLAREMSLGPPITIENAYCSVKIDPRRGGIVSLCDKLAKKNWIAPNTDAAFAQYVYERFDTNDRDRWMREYNYPRGHTKRDFGKLHMAPANTVPRTCTAARGFVATLYESVVGTDVVLHRRADKAIPHDVTLTFSLYRDLPYLDIEWRIDGKPAEPWPEAGWLAFEMNAEKPEFRAVRLGTIVDPAEDFVRGSSRRFFAVNGGVACRPKGEETGLVIDPIDSPVVSLGERGLWRYTPDYVPTKPNIYVNLYNNLWSTNFAQWIEGTWTSRVRVWLEREGRPGLVPGSRAGRFPLLAAATDGPPGTLQPTQAGLAVSDPNVVATAFGPNPDGDGNLLRLWRIVEGPGEERAVAVVLPKSLAKKRFQPCDLRGRPNGAPIGPTDGRLDIPMKPSAPVSLLWNAGGG